MKVPPLECIQGSGKNVKELRPLVGIGKPHSSYRSSGTIITVVFEYQIRIRRLHLKVRRQFHDIILGRIAIHNDQDARRSSTAAAVASRNSSSFCQKETPLHIGLDPLLLRAVETVQYHMSGPRQNVGNVPIGRSLQQAQIGFFASLLVDVEGRGRRRGWRCHCVRIAPSVWYNYPPAKIINTL